MHGPLLHSQITYLHSFCAVLVLQHEGSSPLLQWLSCFHCTLVMWCAGSRDASTSLPVLKKGGLWASASGMLMFPLAFMIAFIFLKSRSGKNKAVPTWDDPGVKPSGKTKGRNSEWWHSCTVKLIKHSGQKLIAMAPWIWFLSLPQISHVSFVPFLKLQQKEKWRDYFAIKLETLLLFWSLCCIGPLMAKQLLGICFAVQHPHINFVHSVKFTSLRFVHRPYHASHIWLKMLSTHPWVDNHTNVFSTTLLILVCLYSN